MSNLPPEQMTASSSKVTVTADLKGTTYVVLEAVEDSYSRIGNYTATSATAAIRKVAEEAGPGTYVAIPERSFAPTKVTVETKQTVKVG
jgi:hypothetical protein